MPTSSSISGSRRRFLRYTSLLALPPSLLLGACSRQGSATTEAVKAAASALPAPGSWVQGGTHAITAAARAANPFAALTASSCTLTCEATIGPCHTVSPERVDVSDGWDGIPMRILLRVVDAACKPVPDVLVEIWHTNHTGGYSGSIERMCNNDEADLTRQFFRGYQRTGADGVVQFESCFPGWYRGRVNHVHFRILRGPYDADDGAVSALTSQLVFSDELNAAIFGNEPLYKDKGLPDTTLQTDGVLGGETDFSPYVFDVQQVEGVMIASKTVVIANAGEKACSVQGAAGGPGGPGGPPPGPPPDGGKGLPPPRP